MDDSALFSERNTAGSRVAAALADHDHDLALAVLIGGKATVGGDTRQITRGHLGRL